MRGVTGSDLPALLAAVAAVSCNGAQPSNQSNTPSPAATVEVQSPAGGAVSATEVDQPPSAARLDSAHGARLASLRDRSEWRDLQALWRELDAVAPPQEPSRDVYAHAIDSHRAEALSTRADLIIRRLEQAKLLSREEAEFFGQAMSTRIHNMTQGSMPLMVMHRMPPPYALRKFASVGRLEQRIDVLVELRDRGRLAASEYQLALEQVQREAVTLYVLYELGRGGYDMAPATIRGTDGKSMLEQIGRRVAEAGADAGVGVLHLAAIADRAKTLVPTIRLLVAELER